MRSLRLPIDPCENSLLALCVLCHGWPALRASPVYRPACSSLLSVPLPPPRPRPNGGKACPCLCPLSYGWSAVLRIRPPLRPKPFSWASSWLPSGPPSDGGSFSGFPPTVSGLPHLSLVQIHSSIPTLVEAHGLQERVFKGHVGWSGLPGLGEFFCQVSSLFGQFGSAIANPASSCKDTHVCNAYFDLITIL